MRLLDDKLHQCSRSRRHFQAECILTALLLTLRLAALALQADSSADRTLLLDVQINGQPTNIVGEFVLRQGILLVKPEELREFRIDVPGTVPMQAHGLVALADIEGVSYKIDQATQALYLTVPPNRLMATVLEARPWELSRKIESGTGATLNYDAVSSFASGTASGTGSLDFRLFSPWGIFSSDWLAYAGPSVGKGRVIRLDAAYTYADVNTLRRYTAGDFVESSLTWTRPVRLEGAQLRSDFSTRPDLITFPMPAVGGQTAIPSTVTVLANGSQVSTSQVEAGPFQIQQLPVITGANTLTMTVTNALGQQVTVSQPFYASSTLLAPGLQTYAVQAGLVRRNWGTQSNDDGKPAGNALYRRGLTRWFTAEGSAEGTPGAVMAGGGGVMTVGHWGVVNLAVAGSTGSEKTGVQYAVGAQRVGRKFSLGYSAVFASRNYRDVAAMNGVGVQRKQTSPYVSFSLYRLGTIGAAYAALNQDAPPVTLAGGAGTALHSKALTANYTLSFHRMSFFATAYRSFDGAGSNRQFQFGLTIPLGRRRSAYLTGSSAGSGQAQVQQSVSIAGDWGYQAYVAADSTTKHEFGQLQYKSRAGLFTGGVDALGKVTTGRMEAQGAISFVDGGFFPSNYVYDSFGIVDTAPVPNIHVLQENREIGKTDRSGKMLVPDMRAFELNRVGVVATDVPPDATLNDDAYQIRPQDRSGVVIKFPMKFSFGALLKLADESGAPIPVGSTATLAATGAAYPVGYNGEAFVENLSPHNELRITRPDERVCAVSFDYKPIPGDLPTIGPLRCVEKRP